MLGYYWSFLIRMSSPVPAELRTFHRREQMARLRGIWRRAARQA
jgi:hypothetical protein